MAHRRSFFAVDGAKLVQLVAAQLATCIVPSLACRLKAVERVDDEAIKSELVLASIKRFFRLVCFILSELTKPNNGGKLDDRVVLGLRQLVSSIRLELLSSDCLSRHLNRLSEQLSAVVSENNVLRFKTSSSRLLDAVDKFENVLRTANAFFKNNNDIFIIDSWVSKQMDSQRIVTN